MIFRAAFVAPVNGPLIRDGFVAVEGQRIAAVGPLSEVPGDVTHDLGDAIITPGLINPHTHLELTCYQGQLAPGPFWDWVLALVGHRQQEGAMAREREGLLRGAYASLRAGTTTVGDISRRGDAWRVLQNTQLRVICFAEVLSFAAEPPRNVDELEQVVSTVEGTRLVPGVSPHAPYSVAPEVVHSAVRLGLPWTMHVAETLEEVAFLAGEAALPPGLQALADRAGVRPQPGSVADYLQRYVPDASGALVHMNYLTDRDVEWLAAQHHTVVYCPRAHRFFGHPEHPLPRLLRAGVRVALGTDSAASNDGLAPLAEVACAREAFPGLCASDQWLRMITLDAAQALGRSDIGSLAPGMLADLSAFPAVPTSQDPVADLFADPPDAIGVWIAGTDALVG